MEHQEEGTVGREKIGLHTISHSFFPKIYKSHMMIETKIIIPSHIQNNDI